MTELPPDLSRLGDVLAEAVARDGARRARRSRLRRRVAVSGATALLAVAAAGAGVLAAPERPAPLLQVAAAPAFGASSQPTAGCDQPRGVRFTAPRGCTVLHPQPQAAR